MYTHTQTHNTCNPTKNKTKHKTGFQTLNILAAQDPAVLSRNAFDSENIAWPLDLTAAGRSSSRMFADASAAVMTTLTTLNSTMNFHHDGIDTSVFQGNEKLNKFYRLISTNVDRKGRGFVSTIEAFEVPATPSSRLLFLFWCKQRCTPLPQYLFFQARAQLSGLGKFVGRRCTICSASVAAVDAMLLSLVPSPSSPSYT